MSGEGKPEDTRYHGTSHDSRGSQRTTSVFKHRNPRSTMGSFYDPGEMLDGVIKHLVEQRNRRVHEGMYQGEYIQLGNVVQASVSSFAIEGEIFKPDATTDSPEYATFWYSLESDGSVKISMPKGAEEALIHFKIPETIGGLIPNLDELLAYAKESSGKEFPECIVVMQLLEVQHAPPTMDQVHGYISAMPIKYTHKIEDDAKVDEEAASMFGERGLAAEENAKGSTELVDMTKAKERWQKDIRERVEKATSTDFSFFASDLKKSVPKKPEPEDLDEESQ